MWRRSRSWSGCFRAIFERGPGGALLWGVGGVFGLGGGGGGRGAVYRREGAV